MKIDSNVVNIPSLEQDRVSASNDNIQPKPDLSSTPSQSNDLKHSMSYDEASGLMQMILSDKLSEDVVRKMPPDDYLKLINLLDKMVSGSVDRQV